jgi:two-component system sensor histidine kinase ChiS
VVEISEKTLVAGIVMLKKSSSYILLVDDVPSNIMLLEKILQDAGYTTASASSGKEALAMAEKSKPALVLLDVMMPDMDGFEVCQKMRTTKDLQTIPVIFLTALDDEESRIKGLQMMGDDYLTKPIHMELLLAKVASTLRLHRIREQAAEVESRQQLQAQVKRQMDTAWKINQSLAEKFHLFVPEQLLQRIAPKGVDSIQLGSAREEEISVLICDIRGFTAITESQLPSQTLAWLNVFFTSMHQAIEHNQGFIDKFMGDALMAVFEEKSCHASDAANAAVMMQQQLAQFNQQRGLYNLQQPLRVGIGIHTGNAVMGTVGSSLRMEPTVIGDVVNTASRLEELTKLYQCNTIASEATINRLLGIDSDNITVENRFMYRWLDCVIPNGKHHSVNLYELLGNSDYAIENKKINTQPTYELGVNAWQCKDYQTASQYFQQVVHCDREDAIAAYHLRRCQQQLGFPLPRDMEV